MFLSKKLANAENEENKEAAMDLVNLISLAAPSDEPKIRVTGIYGDINEEKCSQAIYEILILKNTCTEKTLVDPEDPESEIVEIKYPIDFYISTFGGSAADMFAVYDLIRNTREECPIHTYGVGKVMSAGVLLLASGTKGERRIGKNCRIMIHGVISGQHGHLQDVENEFEEAKLTQKLYIKALAEETNMTERYLKRLVQRKTNVYLAAEEAVELGIADIIF